ncbi:alpha/beta hydrolase [Streptomyces sp. NPDC047009]|uniref:alpha/beta hydrolase n=1 Tax=Streptomyces sp. NPDC047009 TaxID=3154496 RepID=UPI003409ADE6
MTPRSWEGWVERYRAQGYRVIAPAWPGIDGEVEDIRRNPSRTAGVGLRGVIARYEEVIRDLGEAPVIMGHSFGGAVTQVLLDRGLGRAGVAIDSAPSRACCRCRTPPSSRPSRCWATPPGGTRPSR